MSKSQNSKEVAEKRIEFIVQNFPEALKCNPYLDIKLIDRVKKSLVDNGLYNSPGGSIHSLSDTAVINYIRKAQQKPVLKNYRESRRLKWNHSVYEF